MDNRLFFSGLTTHPSTRSLVPRSAGCHLPRQGKAFLRIKYGCSDGVDASNTDSWWRGKRVAVHFRTAPACLVARSPYYEVYTPSEIVGDDFYTHSIGVAGDADDAARKDHEISALDYPRRDSALKRVTEKLVEIGLFDRHGRSYSPIHSKLVVRLFARRRRDYGRNRTEARNLARRITRLRNRDYSLCAEVERRRASRMGHRVRNRRGKSEARRDKAGSGA